MPAPSLSTAAVTSSVAGLDVSHDEPDFDGAKPSAVLAVLADGPHGAEVLLTRRSMDMTNHRGEVSFPGGRLDPGETYEQAALREAHEEVGLDPADVTVVGRLHPLGTWVSKSWIVPVVARVPEPLPLQGRTMEVDRVLWVPLHDFTRPGTFREEWWHTAIGERTIYFFELDDETVWGATARMLHQLLTLAYGPPATRTAR
ncbi:MAG: CoA pyrophosphatase [Acidimicrobiaceae bacterium]|nr:CoA pyrophosphatase [Acidimicrobiaceae bacterium]MCO5331987.1 CoA pyrophosphatase [Ilumatobacteraceae bacterium]